MALYSIWDWNKNLYRVHSNTTPVSVGVDPSPPRPGALHLIGAIPYEHAKTLPAGTRFMGLSHVPRGEVVRDATSVKDLLGLGDDAASGERWKLIACAAAGLVAGFFVGKVMR
jgi:hypothetical protein